MVAPPDDIRFDDLITFVSVSPHFANCHGYDVSRGNGQGFAGDINTHFALVQKYHFFFVPLVRAAPRTGLDRDLAHMKTMRPLHAPRGNAFVPAFRADNRAFIESGGGQRSR